MSEGMVSILEPFLDTLIICTLTGMVILSSGVWTEKFETRFSAFDTEILQGAYSDRDPEHVAVLHRHLDHLSGERLPGYTGALEARAGVLDTRAVTVIHNRSVAEDVRVLVDGAPYDGMVPVADGKVALSGLELEGRSLLHSVPLTAEAFKRSFLGDYGQYAITIGLVLFAFSTAIAWSYYGDRAMTYLVGVRSVQPYRIVYVVGFFLATIADTSFIWLISAVTLALMTLPNLFGIMMLRRQIRDLTDDYWARFKSR